MPTAPTSAGAITHMNKPIDFADAKKQAEKRKYAYMVLREFGRQQHNEKREFLERRAEVERKARNSL